MTIIKTKKMWQKTVKLIGVRQENNSCIKATELTPDLLNHRLVTIKGESGNGKSTLIDGIKASLSGTDAIKKKDALDNKYLAEAQLLDGDIKLYVGAKMREIQRGERRGERELDCFLYAKDDNGKQYTPIVDGVAATASSYMKMLTTELTFDMPSLYSENQTVHRKLIEKLFKPELDRLGADDVVERILELKKIRDNARAMSDGAGAKMTIFEEEGYNENTLTLLQKVNIKGIDNEILQKKLEKDRLVNSSDDAYNLIIAKLEKEKSDKLQNIKDNGQRVREAIRQDNEYKKNKYEKLKKEYEEILSLREKSKEAHDKAVFYIKEFMGDNEKIYIILDGHLKQILDKTECKEPVQEKEDEKLKNDLDRLIAEYNELSETPIEKPKKENIDTSDIDGCISDLEDKKIGAEKINGIYNRYQLWKNWIEAKGLYEKEIDVLRALYASIDCCVVGMNIVPMETDSGRIDVWIMYNGEYDTEFFANPNKEQRFMFQYSSFQRAVIGLMLQSARLNLRQKALRLAFIDDVAFTQKGIDILADIAEKLDLTLITAWTHEVDKNNIEDGQIIVDGGEVFFNKQR
ncbi:MAG: hypothetical protein RR513_06495 [Muribaculaceae bacterium]